MNVDPRLLDIKSSLYRVAVKAVVIIDRKLLLVKDGDDKRWSFPGGGVDYGESTSQALVRELVEELGVSEESIQSEFKEIFTSIGHEKNGIPRCNIHFLVNLKPAQVKITSEISDFKWFGIEEIGQIEFESSVGNISELRDYIIENFSQFRLS